MVSRARASEVAARLEGTSATVLTTTSVGPDSAFHGLFARLSNGRAARMESWHRTAGANAIATDRGLEPLAGRDPVAVLAAQSPEYRRFRSTWTTLEDELTALTREATSPHDVSATTFAWDWVRLQRP